MMSSKMLSAQASRFLACAIPALLWSCLFLCAPQASFGQTVSFTSQKVFCDYVSGFAFGDVDNDGEVELVLTSPRTREVVVLDNQYNEKYRFAFAEAPRDVVIADFHGDGIQRLAVGTSDNIDLCQSSDTGGCLTGLAADVGGFIYIGTVNAAGGFDQEWKSDHLWIRYAPELTHADFNANGRQELIAALSWYSRRLDVYEWNGNGYAWIAGDPIGSDANSAAVGEDVLAVGTGCWSDYAVRAYDSSYTFLDRASDPYPRITNVAVGDIDGDGVDEIVSAVTYNCDGATRPSYWWTQQLRVYDLTDSHLNLAWSAPIDSLDANGEHTLDKYADEIWSTTGELIPGGGEEIAIGTFSYDTDPSDPERGPEGVWVYQYDDVNQAYEEVWHTAFDQIEEDAYELKIYDFDGNGTNDLFVSTTYGLQVYTPTVNGSVVLKVRDENGNGVAGAQARPACGGSWQPTLPGTTDANGNLVAQLPECTTKVRMTVNQGSVEQTNEEMVDSDYTWYTEILRIGLSDHNGAPITDQAAVLNQGGGYWYNWGNLNASGYLDVPLFARSSAYKFKVTYNGTSQTLFPIVSTTAGIDDFDFQTGQVLGPCITKYAAGSWRTFVDGMELMPGTYTFRYPSQSGTVAAGAITNLACQ